MMRYRIPWPPTQNHIWKHTCVAGKPRTYRTQKYKEFLDLTSLLVRPRRPMEGGVMVKLVFSPPDRRRYDVDNRCKAVLDALTHCGVWQDDSQIVTLLACKGPVDKANPGVEILIEEVELHD